MVSLFVGSVRMRAQGHRDDEDDVRSGGKEGVRTRYVIEAEGSVLREWF